tara:strand:+ start:966 stop:1196 length:231 start_codon:yes stop_codon:yes gene_type:complete
MIEYTPDNRITYEEDSDCLYIWKAEPQGQLGAVLLYRDNDGSMVSLDTDEVGTIVGIEINGVTKVMEKFKLQPDRN